MFEAVSNKIIVRKESLTHADLVDILCIGLTGNTSLGIKYDADEYDALPDELKVHDGTVCIEDICASLLLGGKSVYIVDMEAIMETKEELEDLWLGCGKQKAVEWSNDNWACGYEVTLDDIVRALEDDDCKDAVACFKANEADMWDGDTIIQTAAFGEVVFG